MKMWAYCFHIEDTNGLSKIKKQFFSLSLKIFGEIFY